MGPTGCPETSVMAALYRREAQIRSVFVPAFPLKGSLVEKDYAGIARTLILCSCVIYLLVSSYLVVVYCIHGDYMGWHELGQNMWLILRKWVSALKLFYGEALRRRLLEDLVRDIWTVHALWCVTLRRHYSVRGIERQSAFGTELCGFVPHLFPHLVGPQSSVLKCTFWCLLRAVMLRLSTRKEEFWFMAVCSVGVCQRFGEIFCIHLHDLLYITFLNSGRFWASINFRFIEGCKIRKVGRRKYLNSKFKSILQLLKWHEMIIWWEGETVRIHFACSETSCCLHNYWSKKHVHLLTSNCWMALIHFPVSPPPSLSSLPLFPCPALLLVLVMRIVVLLFILAFLFLLSFPHVSFISPSSLML